MVVMMDVRSSDAIPIHPRFISFLIVIILLNTIDILNFCISKDLEWFVVNGNKPEVIKVLNEEDIYLREKDKGYQRCSWEPISLNNNNISNNNNNIVTELDNQQAHNDTPSDNVNSILVKTEPKSGKDNPTLCQIRNKKRKASFDGA
ncbi:hypothetical protein K501DRAFT_266477 [Backusella circina FSU 941]|nr:hypothetical protein K501DRAFT_266477 [Backusella circina FSU 941]